MLQKGKYVTTLANCSIHATYVGSLQLLVIDLGDSCVVKVEQGMMPHTSNDPFQDMGFYGNLCLKNGTTFAEFRAALDALVDGEKPMPRIEYSSHSNDYELIMQYSLDIGLSKHAYDALSQLAGHPLPVWKPKKGEWKRLPDTSMYMGDPLESAGIKVWRYTLTEAE